MQFQKYHALGNDYLVLNPAELNQHLNADEIIRICHRNYGLGSDGILLGPLDTAQADFKLRIFNPDASEAEKSGNGLRIFCRYLYDQGMVKENIPFSVETLGGVVSAEILEGGELIDVGMGEAIFMARDIPVNNDHPDFEVINHFFHTSIGTFTGCCVSVGNPHCVIPLEEISADLAHQMGPHIENHPAFPNRINMQLLKVIDRNNIQIEIWERGAGYTLASGTSSSAAAVIAKKLGHCDGNITVHMPGGTLSITIDDNWNIKMLGPVTPVGTFSMDPAVITQKLPAF